jgi:glucokinase
MRGVIGPGTGLGNSLLYPARIKDHKAILVLPSEGGHTDFPTIDD